MSMTIEKIGFIGGGQMAEALIRGLLAANLVTPDRILVVEPSRERSQLLASRYQVTIVATPQNLCAPCEVLVAAVKPQLAATVLGEYRPHLKGNHLLISIMAGIPLRTLAGYFLEPVRLIRAMPNTPALVLAAATAYSASAIATADDRAIADQLFSAVGTCVEVSEGQLDAVTGLSGSGPGYVFTFIEALIDGGVLAGLPRPVAEQLAVQTVLGSARLALETGEPAAVLKGRVTSPGGTTIAGIQVLESGALRGVVMEAVEAATERSRELGS